METSTIVMFIFGGISLLIQGMFTVMLSNMKKSEDAKSENTTLYRQCMFDKLNDVKKSCDDSSERINHVMEKIHEFDKNFSELRYVYVTKDSCDNYRSICQCRNADKD